MIAGLLVGAVVSSAAQLSTAGSYGFSRPKLRYVAATSEGPAPANDGERMRLSIALARTYRLLGQYTKALNLLATLKTAAWPSPKLEAQYHDEIARDEAALGRPKQAFSELQKALALQPTAERHFRLSRLAGRLGDNEQALRQLQAAVAAAPKNMEYKAALAYLLRSRGDLDGAARLLSEVLVAEPKRYQLHQDLGYVYLSLGKNEKAIDEFKWVIDNRQLLPAGTAKERAATAGTIAGLRETISTVESHWTASAYSNLCLAGPHCNARGPDLGTIISSNQGGVEIAYQPPEIGYVDGRTFQLFARTFFNFTPDTIDPQGKSVQGGIGARYKPLEDYNLVLSGERLVKIGAQSQNNWLARASFSTSSGYVPTPGPERSWYSSFYVDLATTLEPPHQYLTYADARVGPNYIVAPRLVVSPFIYGTFRGNFGADRNTSAETGIGLSLRGLFDFDEDKYHAPAGAVELLPRLGYTVYDTRASNGVVFSISIVARY